MFLFDCQVESTSQEEDATETATESMGVDIQHFTVETVRELALELLQRWKDMKVGDECENSVRNLVSPVRFVRPSLLYFEDGLIQRSILFHTGGLQNPEETRRRTKEN